MSNEEETSFLIDSNPDRDVEVDLNNDIEAPKNEKTTGEDGKDLSSRVVTFFQSPALNFPLARELADTGAANLKTIAENILHAKASMKRKPWILSLIIICSSLAIVSPGVFTILSKLLRLRLIEAILTLYQILFSLLCLAVEFSTFKDPILGGLAGLRTGIRKWCPALQLNVGRGLLHMTTGGLALANNTSFFPGMFLMWVGGLEIVWGMKTAFKIRTLCRALQSGPEHTADMSPGKSLQLLHKKFIALDLNGDGKLTLDELQAGCAAVNLTLLEGEAEMIFNLLDPKAKGWIDVDDLELWWLNAKDDALFTLLV